MPFQIAGVCFLVGASGIAKSRPRHKFAKKFEEVRQKLQYNQAMILAKGDYSKMTEACNIAGIPLEEAPVSKGEYACPYRFGAYKLPAEAESWLKKRSTKKKKNASSRASNASQFNRS